MATASNKPVTPATTTPPAPTPAPVAAPTTPAPVAAPATPAAVLGAGAAVLATATKQTTTLASGQLAVASGVAFAAPVAGRYVCAKLGAGWPCVPVGSKLHVVPGTVAQGGAPTYVLVCGMPATAGTAGGGAVAGAYKAWPMPAGMLVLHGK